MTKNKLDIRIATEIPKDIEHIREVVRAAFDGEGEATVIDKLRLTSPIFISLVAKVTGKVVGHILFMTIRIAQCDQSVMSDTTHHLLAFDGVS